MPEMPLRPVLTMFSSACLPADPTTPLGEVTLWSGTVRARAMLQVQAIHSLGIRPEAVRQVAETYSWEAFADRTKPLQTHCSLTTPIRQRHSFGVISRATLSS